MTQKTLAVISMVTALGAIGIAFWSTANKRIPRWAVSVALSVALVPLAFLQQGTLRWVLLGVAAMNAAAPAFRFAKDRRASAPQPSKE